MLIGDARFPGSVESPRSLNIYFLGVPLFLVSFVGASHERPASDSCSNPELTTHVWKNC